MEHEASVSGSPEHSTGEPCAFLMDADGSLIHAEGAASEIFRRPSDELPGMSFRDLLDPESPASRSAWAGLESGEGFDGELRLLRGDGTVFLANVSIPERRNGDDPSTVRVEIRGGNGSGGLVSRWAGKHYGGAVLRSVDFHLVEGVNGDILRAAPEIEGHLGRSPEAMAGRPLSEHIHPDDLAWARPKLEEMRLAPASTGRIEARLLHADGSWRRFEVVVCNLTVDPMVGGVVWHFRDVSERARVRDDLRRSGAQFRALVEGARDMITLCSDANTILYASPSYKRILGYEPEEMVGLHVPSAIHPGDLQTAAEWAAKISTDPDVTDAPPIRYRHKNGSWVYLESVFTNLMDDPEIRAVAIHSRDVTDRVEAERKLAESEARFRAIIENGQDVVTICGLDNTIRYVSPSVGKVMGYEPRELAGRFVPDLIHPDDRALSKAEAMKVESRHRHEAPVIRYRKKDGSYAHLECVTTNFASDPAIGGGVVHARDVTERVRMEKALAESEGRFRGLVENASDFVVLADEDNVFMYASPAIERVMGYEPRELIGTVVADLMHPDGLPAALAKIAEVTPVPGPHNLGTWRYRHKDGSYRCLEVVVNNKIDDPNLRGVVCNCRDVTERVEAEEKLREAEKRYRTLVEQVPSVNYTLVPAPEDAPGTMSNGSWSYLSPQIEHLLGHPPEAFTSDAHFWNSLVHPDDLEAVLAEDVRTDETGESFEMEYRMRHRDGHFLWVKDDAALVRDEGGNPLLWQCVLSDITRRREAEEEVRRLNEGLERMVSERTSQLMDALSEAEDSEELMRLSESRFRSLVQRSSDITTVIGEDGSVIYVSPAVEDILGYRAGELVEEGAPVHVHPDDAPLLDEALEKVRARPGATAGSEFRFRHKDGAWRHLDAVFTNLSDEPGVSGIVINSRDITERKEAEKRYRTLVEQLPVVTYVQGVESPALEYLSPQFEAMTGYSVEEYTSNPSLRAETIHPDDRGRVMAEDAETDETGEPYAVEHRRVAKDGRVFWVRDDAVLIRDSEGEPLYWQGVMADITDRKEAEDELRQNLNVLLALYETGQILTSTLDLDTRGERLLEVMAGLFGLRAATIDLAEPGNGLRLWKTRGPKDEWEALRGTSARRGARGKSLASGRPEVFRQSEHPGLAPEGVCLPLLVGRRVVGFVEVFGDDGLGRKENLDVFVSLGNQSGSALENARLYSDLAEREKRLEDLVGKLITAQEEERKRVAYEIHDGLAQTALAAHQRLQTFIEDHPPGAVVEENALDRAMELVRQTGREARRVIADLRPTVLDDFGLASALRMHVEAIRRDGMAVEYEESLGETRLPAHVETALYRVAQEALNNAGKHAPGAKVRVSLRLEVDGNIRMEVADDGPGFDPTAVQSGGPGERVGLSSMRERTILVGGAFEIGSRAGGGTKISVEVGSRVGGEDA